MIVYHLGVECYPVAKVRSWADVVGALSKYQNKIRNIEAKVVMTWYSKSFIYNHQFDVILMDLFIKSQICFNFKF